MASNLYVHFPFCRRKCAYCALHSRPGATADERTRYVRSLVDCLQRLELAPGSLATVYFGGGSPALCDLTPLLDALAPRCAPDCEFTVELHPLDVSEPLLDALRAGGVNRISMGVQSLDDRTLAAMRRGYTADTAVAAFALIESRFENAGIDLIVGFPGDPCRFDRLKDFKGLGHCSVYSLQNERGLENVPDDDALLDGIRRAAAELKTFGLERYEISNYARPGRECRHNLAVWRGEDYLGLGEGAWGRLGLERTFGGDGVEPPRVEAVSPEHDLRERTLFRLRTREGLDTASFPEWRAALDADVAAGLLVRRGDVYFLTDRGTEVCDAILAELV